jgi:hypothetical protein
MGRNSRRNDLGFLERELPRRQGATHPSEKALWRRSMSSKSIMLLGVVLAAGCGSSLARSVGLAGLDSALLAGFALGLVLVSQSAAIGLRKRVAALEHRVR